MMRPNIEFLLIVSSPILIGGIIAPIKHPDVHAQFEKFDQWVHRNFKHFLQTQGWFGRWVLRPLFWLLAKLSKATDTIDHDGLRDGIRLSGSIYGVFIWFLIYSSLAYGLVMLAGMIIGFAIGILIVGAIMWAVIQVMLGGGNDDSVAGNFSRGYQAGSSLFGGGSSSTSRSAHSDNAMAMGSYSEEKESFWGGSYTQFYDRNGNKLGYSEVKEGFLGGEYVQVYDESGRKIGHNELKEGFFGGEYVQHYDDRGNKDGWSEDKEDIFGGKYTQHYDENGKKAGWSEKKTDFWGNEYTKHHPED